jgi:hypothetical protein
LIRPSDLAHAEQRVWQILKVMKLQARISKFFRLSTILAFSLGLFLLFQNFNTVPLSALKPDFAQALARPVSPTDGSGDIRKIAPQRQDLEDKPTIATPQSGNDMNSIGQDWLTRQSHLITGGAEERFLRDLNKKLEHLVKPNTDDENSSLEETEKLESANARAVLGETDGKDEPQNPQKTLGKAKGSRGPASVPQIAMQKPPQSDTGFSGLRPTSVRVMSINRVRIGLANKTQVTCSFSGDSMQWDLTHPVTKTFDVNLRHETAQSKSTLQLNYSW